MVYSEYHKSTGVFTSQQVSGYRPPDTETTCWREGAFDHTRERINSGGLVVDYQPPQPSPDHVWKTAARRWVVPEVVAARHARIAAILSELRALDGRLIRPLGELVSQGQGIAADARAMIEEINQQKSTLRAELSKLRAST